MTVRGVVSSLVFYAVLVGVIVGGGFLAEALFSVSDVPAVAIESGFRE